MSKVTLYAKDQSGSIRLWAIEADYTMECLIIEHGILGGEIQVKNEWIDEGKANRSIDEQLDLKMNSRIDKKIKSGYVYDLEAAKENDRVNALGFKRPMTAKRFDTFKGTINWDQGIFIQRKYNGNRCLIHNHNGTLVSYSRYGVINNRLNHILDEIDIPVDHTLDGELYHHGTPLQTINSWIKRIQVNTFKLKYVAYDVMNNSSYDFRLKFLKDNLQELKNTEIAETILVHSQKEMENYFRVWKADGYEGAMMRIMGKSYEDGKRSSSLIKVKKIGLEGYIDEEARVVDIEPSKDGWAILICVTKNGVRFNCSSPGNMSQKYHVMKNKDKFIGKYVNVEFPEWTKDGKPFQPVATRWVEFGIV